MTARLTLVVGPMKSGKSFELIRYFAPLQFTKQNFKLFQPTKNVREEHIRSRNGVELPATKIKTLAEIKPLAVGCQVVGIDEIHMFEPSGVDTVAELMQDGLDFFITGLDLDYRGQLFPIVARLLELAPTEIKHVRAACELCQSPAGQFTQIWHHGAVVTDGLPSVVPEDGTYVYRPVCRRCFKKSS